MLLEMPFAKEVLMQQIAEKDAKKCSCPEKVMTYLRRHCPVNSPAQRFLANLRDIYFVTGPKDIPPPEFKEVCGLDYNIDETWEKCSEYRLFCHFDLGARTTSDQILREYPWRSYPSDFHPIISRPDIPKGTRRDYRAFLNWVYSPISWEGEHVFATRRYSLVNFHCHMSRILDCIFYGIELE